MQRLTRDSAYGGVAPCRHWEALHRQVKIAAPVDLDTVTSSKVLAKPGRARLGATSGHPRMPSGETHGLLPVWLTEDVLQVVQIVAPWAWTLLTQTCDRSNSTGCCSKSWSWYPQSWPPSWHDWISEPLLPEKWKTLPRLNARCLNAHHILCLARPWGWSSNCNLVSFLIGLEDCSNCATFALCILATRALLFSILEPDQP